MRISGYDHKEDETSARRKQIEERCIDGFVRCVRSRWRRLANDRAHATLTLLDRQCGEREYGPQWKRRWSVMSLQIVSIGKQRSH